MKLELYDLVNLVMLSRKGMEVLSNSLPSDKAVLGWNSIGKAEAIINEIKTQEAQKEEETQNSAVKTESESDT